MELKKIFFLSLLCFILSCSEDTEDEEFRHSYYTLTNKSEYNVGLKYYDWYSKISIDTIIEKDSSYTMEFIVESRFGLPFHTAQTIHVSFDSLLVFDDYSSPVFFKLVKFSDRTNYTVTEESKYIRRATYTITNEDYEYSKQKLAEREARNGGD